MTSRLPSLSRAAAVLLACAVLPGCAQGGAHWVEFKGQRFQVEVADDEEERTRGLMFRDSMPDDHGMLFVFERAEPQAFWMKNTRIPLDILYFDADRRFVSMSAGVPPCTTPQCPPYPSAAPAQFTLELNAGVGRRLAPRPGDRIEFSDSIRRLPALD